MAVVCRHGGKDMSDWTHIEDTRPKACKRHQCYLCGLPIVVGEVHIRRYGIGQGEKVAFRMHILCELQTKDWDWTDWECFQEGDLREYMKDWELP